MLSQEIERLNLMATIKSREIDESKSKDSKMEIIINEVEFRKLQNILEQRNNEIVEWRKKQNSLEITITELRSSEGKLFEYENKIALLSQEIKRLNSNLELKVEEVEEWKHKFYDSKEKVFYLLNVYFLYYK